MTEELKSFQSMAAALDGGEIEIQEKANIDGRLYAALGKQRIAAEIQRIFHVKIAPNQIFIEAPIKDVGDHQIRVGFGHGLEAELRVTISAK